MDDLYRLFLKSPKKQHLHDQATLIYIPTCHCLTGSNNIIQHLSNSHSELEVTNQILSTHLGSDSVVFESNACIHFKNGGGWMLPGLDNNFCYDQEVELPMVHVVVYEDKKIRAVRIFWDQASVLKQVGIVGTRGNAWPVTGKEQCMALSKGVVPPYQRKAKENQPPTPDPRRNLRLFEEPPQEPHVPLEQVVKAAEIARPPPRPYEDLFPNENTPAPTPQRSAKGGNEGPPREFSIHSEDPKPMRPSRRGQDNAEAFQFGCPDENSLQEEREKLLKTARGGVRTMTGQFDLWDESTSELQVPPAKTSRREMVKSFSFDDPEPSEPKREEPIRASKARQHLIHFDFAGTPEQTQVKKPQPNHLKSHWGNGQDSPLPAKHKSARTGLRANWSFGDDE